MKHDNEPSATSDLRMDRREFLLALGTGVSLLAPGCLDAEFVEEGPDAPASPLAEGTDPLVELGDPPAVGPALQDDVRPLHTEGVTSVAIRVERAHPDEPIIIDGERCLVPQSLADVVQPGDQVRIVRSADDYALYTVAGLRDSDEPDVVRMGLPARLRLGTSTPFSAVLQTAVIAEGLTDEQAIAEDELVERVVDDGSHLGLVVLAPHGGGIEACTDLQASHVQAGLASRGVSSWICKGWKAGGGAYERWHVTSTAISPRSFPGLATIADRGFAYAVSFHGMAEGGILIGGQAPYDLKQRIQLEILSLIDPSEFAVDVALMADPYNADSPENVVNWITAGGVGGVQIEQGLDVRLTHWKTVADAVINVFLQLL